MTDLFLSYARGDDEPFVKRLYEDLTARGFNVWWDRKCMPSRALTFLQEIRDAIEGCDRLIAVIGSQAVESDYVTSEWQHGHLFAKGVVPILRLGERQLLPPELRKLHCPDFREERPYNQALDELLRILAKPLPPLGPLLTLVPSLPPHFLPRLDEMQGLLDKILADIQRPTVITSARQTTGLWGIGGIGKSVIAAALARATETRRAFCDGIIWVTVGLEEEGKKFDPLVNMRSVGLALGDREGEHYLQFQTACNRLAQVLAPKVCLIILDDVWELAQATPFRNALGTRGRLLITTRQRSLVGNLEAQEHCLDVLTDAESRNLLAGWGDLTPGELPPAAAEVADECGRLPLALSICGALARKGELWEDILSDLKKADLSALSAHLPDYPYDNAYKAMHVSVAYLERQDPEAAGHYRELAVFPEDTPTPEAAVLTLWNGSNGLTERQGRRLLATLADLGLIALTGEAPQRWLAMHDLQHDYLRATAGPEITGLQERLLAAYRQKCPDGWHRGPDDGYFFQRLPGHLKAAGRDGELRDLLLDYRWLKAKLAVTDINLLIRDYDYLVTDPDLPLIQGALRLSGQVLLQDKKQLPGQLTGRLNGFEHPAIKTFIDGIREKEREPWLRPLTPDLTSPGGPLRRVLRGNISGINAVALTRDGSTAVSASVNEILEVWDLETGQVLLTFRGHTSSGVLRDLIAFAGSVESVALTPDGQTAVSASADQTLKVWDLKTGQEIRTLRGHARPVLAVAVTRDGRTAVSGSDDQTLQVWDLETGQVRHTLQGHSDGVNAVALTRDGRTAVSASADKTLKVWDLETGQVRRTLRGHTHWIKAVALTRDGLTAVSASADQTLKVWDLETGQVRHTLQGHSDGVNAVALTRDGRTAVSGSDDSTLKVWDLKTGQVRRTLRDRTDRVKALALTRDGRTAVSGSDDGMLKVWDLETEEARHPPPGHTDYVNAVAVLPNGRTVVSASADQTLKVWDLETGLVRQTLYGHTKKVNEVAVTPDGRTVVSASTDKTLKVWDLGTGQVRHTLRGHTDYVGAVAVTPDGRTAVSASADKTLKVWDLEKGQVRHTLHGHAEGVYEVALTPDGRTAISGSSDKTLKVWDLETGQVCHNLSGHTNFIEAVALTPDGRTAVSASADQTLKVWDLETGQVRQNLTGHVAMVNAVVLTPDERTAISGSLDMTLKVWDLETGREIHTLRGHTHGVIEMALAPAGRTAVSASYDQTLKVWDLEGGKCLTTFTGDTHISACAVGPDGRIIVAGEKSGIVHFLRLEGV